MLDKMSIGLRITLGFLSTVVLMVAIGAFSVFQLKNVQATFEDIATNGMVAISYLSRRAHGAQIRNRHHAVRCDVLKGRLNIF